MHKYESNAHFDRIHCSENTLLLLVKMHLWGLHVYFERTVTFSANHFVRKRKSFWKQLKMIIEDIKKESLVNQL